jgi:hypothetical protein
MRIRSILHSVFCGLATLFLLSIAPRIAAEDSTRSGTTTGSYVDIQDYLPTWQQQDGWLDTTYWLQENFNDVCGDTFCEGDYGNLQAMSYRCSVDAGNGVVGQCVWIFAGSQESIDSVDGKVVAEPRIWQCVTPLATDTRAEELAETLANDQPLFATLPHSDKTLYDGLTDCL